MFGVTLGVVLTTLVVTISISMSAAVRGAVGSDVVDADLVAAARLPSGIDREATRRILAAAVPAVAVPMLQANTRLADRDDAVLSVLGVTRAGRRLVPKFDPSELALVRPAPGTAGLLLGRGWAEERGIRKGDVIPLVGPTGEVRWTVTGLVSSALPNAGAVGLARIADARLAFGRPGKTDAIYVRARPGMSHSKLEERLRVASRGSAVVGDPTISSRADEASLLAVRGMLAVVALLGVAAAALVVFVSWRLLLEDERRNISRFLLNGATVRDLALGSGLVMGGATLICAAIGTPIGFVLGKALSSVSQQLAGFTGVAAVPEPSLGAATAVAGIASACLMTGIAWLVGVRAMRSVPVIDAFRVERPDVARAAQGGRTVPLAIAASCVAMAAAALLTPTDYAALGLVVVVASACLLAYFVPLGFAMLIRRLDGYFPLAIGRYLAARSARVALLTTTFGVGIAACLVLGGLIQSFQTGLSKSVESWTQADLFVRPGWAGSTMRDTRFPADLRSRLAAVDGVERAGAWTFTMVESEGRRFMLQGWDTANTRGVVDLITYDGPSDRGLWRALDNGQVAISQSMSRLRDLDVGDRIEVPTADGVSLLPIGAVVDDYLSDNGAVITSLSKFRRLTGDPRLDSIQLKLRPGESPEVVADRVRRELPDWPGLVVATRGEMQDRVTGVFDSLVSVLGGLTVAIFALVMLVASTTTAAALNARRGSLALSALCGAPPRAVRRQLFTEGLVIGGAAWLAGAPAGLLALGLTIGVLSLSTGLLPEVVVPLSTLALTLPLVLVASVTAVWLPARRLPREIVRSLRFD